MGSRLGGKRIGRCSLVSIEYVTRSLRGDSVPFQECLKEPRWSAYREGRLGETSQPAGPRG